MNHLGSNDIHQVLQCFRISGWGEHRLRTAAGRRPSPRSSSSASRLWVCAAAAGASARVCVSAAALSAAARRSAPDRTRRSRSERERERQGRVEAVTVSRRSARRSGWGSRGRISSGGRCRRARCRPRRRARRAAPRPRCGSGPGDGWRTVCNRRSWSALAWRSARPSGYRSRRLGSGAEERSSSLGSAVSCQNRQSSQTHPPRTDDDNVSVVLWPQRVCELRSSNSRRPPPWPPRIQRPTSGKTKIWTNQRRGAQETAFHWPMRFIIIIMLFFYIAEI